MFGLPTMELVTIWILELDGKLIECSETLALSLVEEHGGDIVRGRAPGVALTIKGAGTYYLRLAHTDKSTI
jgi:hypothetical protein